MRPLSGEITVNISIEMVVTSRLQNQTMVPCEVKVATKIFDCILVSLIQVVDVSCTHLHCHQNIWVGVLSKKVQLASNQLVVPGSIKWSSIWIGRIKDETHLELKILNRLEIDYEIHSHSVHEVRKLYMRYIQG